MRAAWSSSKRSAGRSNCRCVAAGDVHMHRRGRRALQDVLTAIRLNIPLERAGVSLYPNGERCLRPLRRLQEIYPAALLAQTLDHRGALHVQSR